MESKYKIIVVLELIFILSILSVMIYKQNINPNKEFSCSYDKEISLQKARFDFLNAYNNYPYDTKKIDFVYSLQYANCGDS